MTNEELLKFQNREKLFRFLIDDYGMTVIEERYYEDVFGNFYVELSGPDFFLRYVIDRLILEVVIRSKHIPSEWYSLSFIKDLLYSDEVNSIADRRDNLSRLNDLNNFLKEDYNRISYLFNENNNVKTHNTLDRKLKEQFKKNFPNA